ncbi:MAG: hypothetical protein P4N60_06625 [Verrucomicrobiae bacterium]|nr:hypothetical protein [Verrucomicrobiae bacterium]
MENNNDKTNTNGSLNQNLNANTNGAAAVPGTTSVSERKREANRRNGLKSTGPKSPEGRAVSRMNALKHGLASKEVLVRGLVGRENVRELAAWHERFHSQLQPVGPIEELLVDQIVTLRWRLRRVLTAEAGEIALGTDQGQWDRKCKGVKETVDAWLFAENDLVAMGQSAIGNMLLEEQCELVRAVVAATGEISQEVLSQVTVRGQPYGLTRKLTALRAGCPPAGASTEARAAYQAQVLEYLRRTAGTARRKGEECEQREQREEESRQAVAALPGAAAVDKIVRYESALERHLGKALDRLERLQAARKSTCAGPPCKTIDV